MTQPLERIEMLTQEQLAERRKGVTATDVGKIVGQSPYGCALDVLMDKQGVGRPFIEHPRVKWGNLLEDPIRRDYADRLGVDIESGDDIGTLKHPTLPWAMATPDGLVTPKGRAFGKGSWGHEIKTHTQWLAHLYGEPGTDEVPLWELVQCAWNILVTSAHYGIQLERWDLTVFLDGLPTDYTIWRDEDLELALVEAAKEFWEVHVIGGEPIAPDGSDHYSAILKDRWERNTEEIIEATPEHLQLIEDLRAGRAAKKAAEKEEERLVQETKLILGDASGLQWPELINGKEKLQKITWRRSADSRRVDWKAVAEAYRRNLEEIYKSEGLLEGMSTDLDLTQEALTSIQPGSRRFVVPRGWGAK